MASRAVVPVGKRAIGNAGKLSAAELEQDVQLVLEKLQEGDNLIRIRRWCMDPPNVDSEGFNAGGRGWTDHHTRTVMARAKEAMVVVTRETAETTRARLLAIAERGLNEVATPLFYHGQRVIDPETGKGLYRVDHLARQGYLTFIADLSGLRKTVVEHRDNSARPAQEMTDEEIMQEIERLESVAADRADPVEATVVEDAASKPRPKAAR